MSPVRLFVLAVLFYVGWRLIKGMNRKTPPQASSRHGVEDVLVEDPVCHTLIPRNQAIRLRHEGTTLYFCSEKCCDTFINSAKEEETT